MRALAVFAAWLVFSSGLRPQALCLPVLPPSPSEDSACAGIEVELESARKALDENRLADAESRLMALQAAHQECATVLVDLARLRAAQKNNNAAEELFLRAIQMPSVDSTTYSSFAQFSLTNGQYQKTDYLVGRALEMNPDDPDALVIEAQILTMKRQNDAARRALEKACRLDPKNAEAHFQLGVWFDNRKLHSNAVQEFEKVTLLRSNDPRAYDYLALNLESQGDAKNAEEAYRKGLSVNTGPYFDSFLDYNYGRLLLKENRLQESRTHLDRALTLAPETRAVQYEHAKLNMRSEKYREARVDGERALSLQDRGGFVLDLQVYYLLASVYSKLGEEDLARKYRELCRTTSVPVQSAARE